MSDHVSPAHNRKKHVHVLGTTRKKKFFRTALAVLFIIGAVAGYALITSGVLADNSTAISQQLLTRINDQRHAENLAPVGENGDLMNQAGVASGQLKLSPLAYSPAPGPGEAMNVYVLPKMSLAFTSLGIEQQLFDKWSADESFRTSVTSPQFRNVGIGVDSDGYNYYIVTVWK